jgi:hypothetical protein
VRRDVDEYPALAGVAELRVVAERVAHEVGQLGERLDACVTGADEDERELPLAVDRGGRGGGCLEPAQHVIAQMDGVGERLEPERVLGEARDRQRPGDGPQSDDELRVRDRPETVVGLDLDPPALGVELAGSTEQELGVRAHHPQRHDDVTRLERPGRRLRQQRRVQHEVLGGDDRRAAFAEQARDVAPGEPAAEHERAAACLAIHTRILPWRG